MTDQNINEALIAIGAWAALGEGYPIPDPNKGVHVSGNDEETRDFIKEWSKAPTAYNATQIRGYVNNYIQDYRATVAEDARRESIQKRILARQSARIAIVGEMRQIRAALGLTQGEMDKLLGIKGGMIQQIENAGSYGIDTFNDVLEKARVQAKLNGINVTGASK